MKQINIYTDGACSGNQNDNNIGGWGAALVYNENVKEIYGGAINTTNNIMEMTAIIEALKAIKSKDVAISIYSDSAYVVNCMNDKWYVKWQKNGWMNSAKKPVENKELWETLIALVMSFKEITFYKIKGHLDPMKTAEINKWMKKFNDKHKPAISREAYLHLVLMNNRADALANIAMDEIRQK